VEVRFVRYGRASSLSVVRKIKARQEIETVAQWEDRINEIVLAA